jgi:tetratricopeptide (TPR) repeat protein
VSWISIIIIILFLTIVTWFRWYLRKKGPTPEETLRAVSAESDFNAAELHLSAGDYAKAISLFRSVIDVQHEHEGARFGLIVAFLGLGLKEEALEELGQIERILAHDLPELRSAIAEFDDASRALKPRQIGRLLSQRLPEKKLPL